VPTKDLPGDGLVNVIEPEADGVVVVVVLDVVVMVDELDTVEEVLGEVVVVVVVE
jgi:hypothetical protein